MKREDIPPDRWQDFCNEFSRRHKGALVTVDVIGKLPSRGKQGQHAGEYIVADEMPLQGIAVEQKGDDTYLFVTVGEGRDGITHRVVDPSKMCFEQTDDGAHTCLNISSKAGQTTRICFQATVRP